MAEEELTIEQLIERLGRVKRMASKLPVEFQSVHNDLADLYDKIRAAQLGTPRDCARQERPHVSESSGHSEASRHSRLLEWPHGLAPSPPPIPVPPADAACFASENDYISSSLEYSSLDLLAHRTHKRSIT